MGVPATLRFMLDGRVQTLEHVDPCMTVLDWLREHALRPGTKEGCAEGDCGACTVAIGDVVEGRLRYRAVNACIAVIGSLDGRELVTVESLAGEQLHPVQRAMVDHHGSQCGFCTPGIVMSLFALYRSQTVEHRHQVDDALAGNLCRCTGYRPILDAALQMQGEAAAESAPQARTRLDSLPGTAPTDDELAVVARLEALTREASAFFEGPGFDNALQRFSAPRTLEDLLHERAAHPHAMLLAGSTEAGVWINKAHRDLGHAISPAHVAELHEAEWRDGELHLGAGLPLTDVHGLMLDQWPELDEIFARFASPPVRNVATLGGNLANASPIGDMAPAFIALDARVRLASVRRQRDVPLHRFFRGYRETVLADDEIIRSIIVPARESATHLAMYKVSRRIDQDISSVSLGLRLTVSPGPVDAARVVSARVALGGVAATPVRLEEVESALVGVPVSGAMPRDALARLAAGITPMTDVRASADYRRRIAGNLMRRGWLAFFGDEPVRLDDAAGSAAGEARP